MYARARIFCFLNQPEKNPSKPLHLFSKVCIFAATSRRRHFLGGKSRFSKQTVVGKGRLTACEPCAVRDHIWKRRLFALCS